MNKFFVGFIALISTGIVNVSAQNYTEEVTVSNPENTLESMVRLSPSDGCVYAGGLRLNAGGAWCYMNPSFRVDYDSESSIWNVRSTTYTRDPTSPSGSIPSLLRFDLKSMIIEGEIEANGSAAFNSYCTFRRGASIYESGFEVSRLDGEGLKTSNRFTLYSGSLRQMSVPRYDVKCENDPDANSYFFSITTISESGGGTGYYPQKFFAKNFSFEGESFSFGKMGASNAAVTLSGEGGVSAGALSLRHASAPNLDAKYDDESGAWNLGVSTGSGEDESLAALNVNVSNLDVKGKVTCGEGLDVKGYANFNDLRSSTFSCAGRVFSSSEIAAVGVFSLYAQSHKNTPQLIASSSRSESGVTSFSLSTKYTAPSGSTSYSSLVYEALDHDFIGSSLSLKKIGSDAPAVVLSDSGYVTSKGLSLYTDSINKKGLSISSNAGVWELSAPSDFNMNVSKLNVSGPIVCKDQMKVAAVQTDTLRANDIKVNMKNVADYVFEEDYDLKSLDEVESFVKENKHLPGVPSASQMEENGMSVSEMSNLLLEKVEELTLHLIRVEKENRALKAEIEQLKNK